MNEKLRFIHTGFLGMVYLGSDFLTKCHCPSSESDLSKFTLTKNAINKNGVEITIYAEVVSDVTIIVEGR